MMLSPSSPASWWRRHGAFAAASALATALVLAAYSNHFHNAFHFDDSHVILDNLYIRSLDNLPRFFTDPHTFSVRPENALYRPLLTLSHALDYRVGGGLDPLAFHRTQFGLLLLLGALLVLLYRDLLELGHPARPRRWLALFAATLFCVHTANTETINYISSRSSLVATLGVVAAFLVWTRWPRLRRFGLYLLPAVVCGLAKPLTVMFAPLLTLYLLLDERLDPLAALRPRNAGRVGRVLARTLPAWAAGAGLYLFLRAMDADTLLLSHLPRSSYLLTQPFVWLHYFRLFLLPVGLTADTDWAPVAGWHDPRVWIGAGFVAALGAAIVLLARRARARPAVFGLGWFAIALLPTSSVIPLSEVYNEHRIFFPYVGLTLAAAVGGAALADRLLGPGAARTAARRALVAALALGLLAAHAAGTYRRNRVWRTELSLWEDVAAKSPGNGRGLMNYGVALMRRGELSRARELFERARTLLPAYEVLEVNLGIVKSSQGDGPGAESHFRRALTLRPGYARGRYFYGKWLAEQGRAPEAVEQLERAVAISAGDLDTRELLARLYAARGDGPALERLVRGTLEIAPADPVARAFAAGRPPEPGTFEDAGAWSALARRRLARSEWLAAAAACRQALSLGGPPAALHVDLGLALEHLGFRDEAAASYRAALGAEPGLEPAASGLTRVESGAGKPAAPAAGSPAVDALIRESVELYRAGRFEDSAAACERALWLDPASILAYNNLCSAEIALGRREAAIRACERALELDPQFERARANLDWARGMEP